MCLGSEDASENSGDDANIVASSPHIVVIAVSLLDRPMCWVLTRLGARRCLRSLARCSARKRQVERGATRPARGESQLSAHSPRKIATDRQAQTQALL